MLDVLWSFRPRLRRLVRRFGVPAHDVEDVVQEAMLGAWRSIEEGRWQPAEYTAALLWRWVQAIAWRQARRWRERALHRHSVATDPHAMDELTVPDIYSVNDIHIGLDGRRVLTEVLNEIPVERRRVFIAHELLEIEMCEVAAALSIPLSTAWSRRRIALIDVEAAKRRWSARHLAAAHRRRL